MAGLWKFLLILCVGVNGVITLTGENRPLCGLMMRITSGGLNYANTVMLSKTESRLKGHTIDDVSHQNGHMSYHLTKIKVKEFSIPSSAITTLKGKGFRWIASQVKISVSADFKYKYEQKLWFITIPIQDHGSFSLDVVGASLDVETQMNVDGTGRPTIWVQKRICDISQLKLKFHGKMAILYNGIGTLFQSRFKKILQQMLCDTVDKIVNTDLENSLKRTRFSVNFEHKFVLDYSLASRPAFGYLSMETYHKGVVYWNNQTDSPPFKPKPFPEYDTKKMVQIWVSDFVINSWSFQAQKHGLLKKTLTNKDFRDGKSEALSTSCKFGKWCIGKVLPDLRKNFPDCNIELDVMTSKAPVVALQQGSLVVRMDGGMSAFVRQQSIPGRHYLFTINMTMTSNVSITYSRGYLHGKLGQAHFDVCISNTTLVSLREHSLNFILQNVVRRYLQSSLDKLGTEGFPILKSDDVELVNTDIHVTQHAIILATDVKALG